MMDYVGKLVSPFISTKMLGFILLLIPSMSWAWVGTSIQTGHSAYCNYSLSDSILSRKDHLGAVLSANFAPIKAQHQKLDQMNDEEFKRYIVGEVGAVAFCHPLSSELLGVIPGTDYLGPLNSITSLPSSYDRKITYGIWAYSAAYRNLSRFIRATELKFPEMAAWDQGRYISDLASAKRWMHELKGKSLDQLVNTDGMSQEFRNQLESTLREIKSSSGNSSGQQIKDAFSERLTQLETRPPINAIPSTEVASPNSVSQQETLWLDDVVELNNVAIDQSARPDRLKNVLDGVSRPTISTYTLKDQTLYIHEVNIVYLFFPSSLGPKNSCFKRFAPDYPMFARFLTEGSATLAAQIELSESESSELLKFFESASRTSEVSGFMISDTAAVVRTKDPHASSLSRCLSLVEETSSHVAHQNMLSIGDTGEFKSDAWLTGLPVAFSANDRIWQSLMAMLAAKRIEYAQSKELLSNRRSQ
ncbi:hypothetical protein KG088_17720 [Halomonas sp. TRM85114]|uniref:hypothetical protein n=1 Tax=Halomonas jincaotanensis TaxID=2810616 RepID=UPI001BD574DB|nr:hypothetical protein [Halomonas jincaotanensis]MBS9405446.1 hypothetical protein [Halomonas jincaotanensis]